MLFVAGVEPGSVAEAPPSDIAVADELFLCLRATAPTRLRTLPLLLVPCSPSKTLPLGGEASPVAILGSYSERGRMMD